MTFRWLVRAAAWLDKRFPPKVVVTQEQFEAIQERVHRQQQQNAKLAGELVTVTEKLAQVEKSLAALKEGIVKGEMPISTGERARLRDSFVKGEWPSRVGLVAGGPVPSPEDR